MKDEVFSRLKCFFERFSKLNYKKEEAVLHQGERPRGIYFLETGFVRMYHISSEGTEITLHIFSPGAFFPMLWAIQHTYSPEVGYETITPCSMYLAPSQQVINFLTNDPKLLLHFTSRLLKGLDKFTSRIISITTETAYKQVISIILDLTNHFGQKQGKMVTLSHYFTHQDIATIAGMARETVSIEIEKLEKKGLILYNRHLILIPSIKRLKTELTTAP